MLVSTTILNFLAFRYLQLDEALAILFSTPFLVAIAAGPLLGEWVGWRRWTAIVVGFIGVLVVIRPGMSDGMQWAALFSVGGGDLLCRVRHRHPHGVAHRLQARRRCSMATWLRRR